MEKNRHKRPTLEEVLKHPWFAGTEGYKARVSGAGKSATKFTDYAMDQGPNSPKIREEMEKVAKEQWEELELRIE